MAITVPVEPSVGQVGDWVAVHPSQGKRPHRGVLPAALRLRCVGSCEANAAACHLLAQISAERTLSTHTPLRCTVAREPVTTNPVLVPCESGAPESVALRWRTGYMRVTCNLQDVFRALEKPLRASPGTAVIIPVDIVRDPATNLPGLMLRLDQLSVQTMTRRGARTRA